MKAVAAMVTNGNVLADGGTDHGYVPIMLVHRGFIPSAIAMDVNEGPLQRARENIIANQLQEKIDTRLSDGVSALSDGEVESIVIAGMGGKLIKEILQENENKLDRIETIIVDAHNDRPILISYLESINYQLIDNDFFYEGKIAYDVMKWAKGKTDKPYSEEEVFFGPLNLKKKSLP